MLLSELFILLCFVTISTGSPSVKKLNKFVSNFEELSYDRSTIHARHTRSVKAEGQLFSLKFNAFNRDFNLRLRRDTSIFAEGFEVESTESDGSHFPYYVCTGYVASERYSSHVYGSVLDGRFQGQIIRNGSIYYVEPADRYFDPNDVKFHSVIYMDKHVKDIGEKTCGLGNELFERMKQKQNIPKEDQINLEETQGRVKRQSNGRRTCDLYIKADHTYFKKYGSTQAVVAAISEHVMSANEVFQSTIFGIYTNINLAVARIKIFSTPDGNKFSDEYIGVERFLDLASSDNYNQYCLSYTFANRDFSNGVLGLAWIASANRGTSGGICDKYRNGKSLNTGIVTENNYGADVPARISSLTFTHELGHSFGSPHDARADCLPGMPNGNYLMYAYSSNADQPNNDKFSSCSVGNITNVLGSVFNGISKQNCFKTLSEISLCGNKIIEGDEQCDCGYEDGDCTETCCVAQNDAHNAPNACRLRSGSQCSPSQGPCCSNNCVFRSSNYVCSSRTDCRQQSTCTSNRAACPMPGRQRDDTKCNNGTMVCKQGTCSGSICDAHSNLESCLCESTPNKPASELCQVCCQNINNPASCVPASDINILDMYKNVIYMPIGSACNNKDGNFRGYCDVFNECQNVDEDGPLASIIKRIFFSDEETVDEAIKTWIEEQWYVLLIGILVLIAVMVGTVFLCTKVIPTHNPHKREKEQNKLKSSQAVKMTNRKYRGSQMPGLHPVGTDQHPDQAENKATRF
ncbi:disintegrin and metalloproteinase domain-containing protein 10-like isoform X2 [Anneissia japonica]|uniref:disintegrin and metalloproteinase domain-containing protein 10-like isoform X2 n=1 Tax=Anneissia japonica TaxID=1529436 RepID=UPI0014256516|nr:disintegrin and metalloproteinase domain-containing protein 10-like isoform X2 [Anneissia japonica]